MNRQQQFGVGLIIVLAVSVFVLFWHLGQTPLTNWDEGIYAEVTRTTHSGGSWWLPTYHGQLFLEKPPLTFWLMNLSFHVFGVNELGVRFWSATAGLLTALLVTMWTWQMTKKPLVATLAGLFFVTGRFLFFHSFRTGDTDSLLVLFLTLALYSYWQAKTNDRWWWLVGVGTGLAVMTKSFVGLLPLLIVAIDVTTGRQWSGLPWKRVWQGVGWFAVVALPWHVAAGLSHGSELWRQSIGFNLVERSSTIIASANVPWYWYGRVILNFCFPASAFILLAVIFGGARWRRGEANSRLLILAAIVPLILFSLAQTKYDHYIQPVYPVLAILLALMVRDLWSTTKFEGRLKSALWLTIAWFIFLMPPRLAHDGALWQLTPYGWLPESWAHGSIKIMVAIISVGVLWAVTWFIGRQWKKSSTRIILAVVLSYIFILSLGWQYSYLKHLPTSSRFKTLAAETQRIGIGQVQMVNISHLSEPAGYFYFHRAGIRTTESTQATELFVVRRVEPGQASSGYDAVITQGRYQLQQQSQGLQPVGR